MDVASNKGSDKSVTGSGKSTNDSGLTFLCDLVDKITSSDESKKSDNGEEGRASTRSSAKRTRSNGNPPPQART